VLDKQSLPSTTKEGGPHSSELKKKYLLASKDRIKRLYRIAPELREHVRFRRLNFMDGDFGFREPWTSSSAGMSSYTSINRPRKAPA